MGADTKDELDGFYLAENIVVYSGPWSHTLLLIILWPKGADSRNRGCNCKREPRQSPQQGIEPAGLDPLDSKAGAWLSWCIDEGSRDWLQRRQPGPPDRVTCASHAPRWVLSVLPLKHVQNPTLVTIFITVTLN